MDRRVGFGQSIRVLGQYHVKQYLLLLIYVELYMIISHQRDIFLLYKIFPYQGT
jgi:hypothetical protein